MGPLVVARDFTPRYYYGMSRRGTVETSQQQRGVKTQQQRGFITLATTMAWPRGTVETAQQQRGVKTSATAINLVVARVKNPRYYYGMSRGARQRPLSSSEGKKPALLLSTQQQRGLKTRATATQQQRLILKRAAGKILCIGFSLVVVFGHTPDRQVPRLKRKGRP